MKIKTIEDIKRLCDEGKLTHFVVNNKCENSILSAYYCKKSKVKIFDVNDTIIGYRDERDERGYLEFKYVDLEETEKLIKGEKEMTKSDLKDGMVVELRNGNKYVVLLGKIMNISNYTNIHQYDDKLEMKDMTMFDIVKIFNSKGWSLKNIFDNEHLSLIWKREEKSKVKIKLDSIEKQIEELQKSAKDLREEIKK